MSEIDPAAWKRAIAEARAAWLADRSDTTLDHHIKVILTAALSNLTSAGYRISKDSRA